MKVLKSSDFLSAELVVINSFYTLDALNVDSENFLVQKLDEYIVKYQENIPDILKKLKPAIENLRNALITDLVTNKCSADFKHLLIQLKDGNTISKKKCPRKKMSLLSQLPIEMLEVLYKKFTDEICYNAKCEYAVSRKFRDSTKSSMHFNALNSIYNLYKHTNLSRYSDDHIKQILDVFKSNAFSAEYKIFANYEDYLV